MNLFKKISYVIPLLISLSLLLLFPAHCREWPLYEQFAALHQDESQKEPLRFVPQMMFFALIQDDRTLFAKLYDRTKAQKSTPESEEESEQKPHTACTSDSMWQLFLAYDLLEADRLWQTENYAKDALFILDGVLKHNTLTSRVLGQVLLPASEGFTTGRSFTLRPGALAPFIIERVSKERPQFRAIGRNTYQSIVRGSGDGFIADYMLFDYDGNFITTTRSEGTADAAAFYLWLGITSISDPNRKLLLPVYQNLIDNTNYNLFSPRVANLFFHTLKGEGSIIFDSCILPVVEGKTRDYLRTRIKAHVFAKDELEAHLLTLFATGHDEHRFAFNHDGTIKTETPALE